MRTLARIMALVAVLCSWVPVRSAELPAANTVQPPAAYPFRKSANGRYLVDSAGRPFLMAGLRPLKVDLSQLRGPVNARWYDPSCGRFSSIKGSPFANSGKQDFIAPGNNADGDGDWLLVLESK